MATIERYSLTEMNPTSAPQAPEAEPFLTGLRIAVRATTASLADYHDFNLSDLLPHRNSVVTDGACS